MFITNFLYGLLLIGIGVVMLKFNFQLTNSFSRNNVFERRLGPGSTFLVMQVMAIIVVVFGTLTAVSLHDNVLSWILSPLTGLFR